MGFYVRKSVKAGPFRVNLSKSGIGLSAGVPGFRVGSGPRGTYVHMGRNGVYYRQTLSPGRRSSPHARQPRATFVPSPNLVIDLPRITVLDMTEGSPSTLVDDLNRAAKRFALSPLAWISGRRRVAALYDVNDEAAAAFESLLQSFGRLRSCRGSWLLDAQGRLGTTYQQKVNAGASSLVNRSDLNSSLEPPKVLATNIVVPGLVTKAFSVHLLPDRLLVRTRKRFTSWRYSELTVRSSTIRFIESGRVPPDATLVGQTWQYANVSGGPDRRFKNNRRLPILAYEEIEVTADGLRLLFQFSNTAAAKDFASHLDLMRLVPGHDDLSHTPGGHEPTPWQEPQPAAGWYRDPSGQGGLRWWDGHAWTNHVA